jgi:hypothetical protein
MYERTSDFETIAKRLIEIVPCGLSKGLGVPKLGHMCVEAAVCYAMGMPHDDSPDCVGDAVRRAKIFLNDSNWSSDQARADGLLKISIAQLGSKDIDQLEFATKYVIKTVNKLISKLFSQILPDFDTSELSNAETLEDCIAAASAARAAASTASVAARYAAGDVVSAARYAVRNAAWAAWAAAIAATRAAETDTASGDAYFRLSAELILECLQELDCEGCEYLYLLA